MKKIKADIKVKKPTGQTYSYDIYEDDKGNRISVADEVLWAEKYRPRIIEDLILPKDIIGTLTNIISKQEIPNMLLYSVKGGLGKDSIISVLTNAIPNTMLTINASLHRDINTIRTTVVEFASRKSLDGSRKIIYLNEVGGLTKIALDSLKAIIEDYSSQATFLMTTNSMNNISHPLQSRFQFFDMDVIDKEEKKELLLKTFIRLKMILELEEIDYDVDKIKQLLKLYFPRYRELLIALQKYVSDGKLMDIQKDLDILPTILEHINNIELKDIIALSETIDIYTFLFEMNKNILTITKKPEDLADIIEQLDELQTKFNNRVPFPNISFINFCQEMMRREIQFNIIKGGD